jgi:pentatricopeptide repeat protein
MNASGVKPDVITFNASVSACGKAGKVEEAMRVFGEINASDTFLVNKKYTLGKLLFSF